MQNEKIQHQLAVTFAGAKKRFFLLREKHIKRIRVRVSHYKTKMAMEATRRLHLTFES